MVFGGMRVVSKIVPEVLIKLALQGRHRNRPNFPSSVYFIDLPQVWINEVSGRNL
jgi:hypothetical protein